MSTAPTATTYTHDDVVGLAMTIRGRVVLPVNTREFRAELERSHKCGFWSRHPLMFVLCHDAPDVQRALEFCKRFQLPLSVRSGGHSACGSSVTGAPRWSARGAMPPQGFADCSPNTAWASDSAG